MLRKLVLEVPLVLKVLPGLLAELVLLDPKAQLEFKDLREFQGPQVLPDSPDLASFSLEQSPPLATSLLQQLKGTLTPLPPPTPSGSMMDPFGMMPV
jgi:hypothetical protein